MFDMILKIAMVVIAIVLVILCLLQSGKSDDIVNALTGQSSNLFAEQKERGVDLVMSRMTMILSIAFFVIAILLRMN
ncbi:MAG: preprotein translocase subunit SecG [Faecalibacillus faecis]